MSNRHPSSRTDWTTRFRDAFVSPWKSRDFWLFGGSFVISGLSLPLLPKTSLQVAVFVAILTVSVGVSVLLKRRTGWTRRDTGWKGGLYAALTMSFVGYGICMFSLHAATLRQIELDGPLSSRLYTSLSDPVVFGIVMPFVFLGILASAIQLGLTDFPD